MPHIFYVWFVPGWTSPSRNSLRASFSQSQIIGSYPLQILFLQFLEIEQRVLRLIHGPDEFVQFDVHSFGVSVLGVLDYKNH